MVLTAVITDMFTIADFRSCPFKCQRFKFSCVESPARQEWKLDYFFGCESNRWVSSILILAFRFWVISNCHSIKTIKLRLNKSYEIIFQSLLADRNRIKTLTCQNFRSERLFWHLWATKLKLFPRSSFLQRWKNGTFRPFRKSELYRLNRLEPDENHRSKNDYCHRRILRIEFSSSGSEFHEANFVSTFKRNC